jgi:hypothetical protein
MLSVIAGAVYYSEIDEFSKDKDKDKRLDMIASRLIKTLFFLFFRFSPRLDQSWRRQRRT